MSRCGWGNAIHISVTFEKDKDGRYVVRAIEGGDLAWHAVQTYRSGPPDIADYVMPLGRLAPDVQRPCCINGPDFSASTLAWFGNTG